MKLFDSFNASRLGAQRAGWAQPSTIFLPFINKPKKFGFCWRKKVVELASTPFQRQRCCWIHKQQTNQSNQLKIDWWLVLFDSFSLTFIIKKNKKFYFSLLFFLFLHFRRSGKGGGIERKRWKGKGRRQQASQSTTNFSSFLKRKVKLLMALPACWRSCPTISLKWSYVGLRP